jgi:DNA-binding transcriptional ArsR family regulator
MRQLKHPELENIPITDVLYALADPLRLKIVCQLSVSADALTCKQLSQGRPKSSMSHHFRILRMAGVIRTHIDGKEHFNMLRRAELEQRFPGLLPSILR